MTPRCSKDFSLSLSVAGSFKTKEPDSCGDRRLRTRPVLQVHSKQRQRYSVTACKTVQCVTAQCYNVTVLQRQCYSIGERLKTVSVDVPRLPQAAVKVFIENVDERQQ